MPKYLCIRLWVLINESSVLKTYLEHYTAVTLCCVILELQLKPHRSVKFKLWLNLGQVRTWELILPSSEQQQCKCREAQLVLVAYCCKSLGASGCFSADCSVDGCQAWSFRAVMDQIEASSLYLGCLLKPVCRWNVVLYCQLVHQQRYRPVVLSLAVCSMQLGKQEEKGTHHSLFGPMDHPGPRLGQPHPSQAFTAQARGK